MLYTSLSFNTTPIHCPPPPPVMNTHSCSAAQSGGNLPYVKIAYITVYKHNNIIN